jgi:hypothetical protein
MADSEQSRIETKYSIKKPNESLLNTKPSIDELANRIYQRLVQSEAAEPIVVGLYGEWGSGKSHWLEAIQYGVVAQNERSNCAEVVIVPVLFNAWRYEKEPHLIIPLLKTLVVAAGAIEDQRWETKLKTVAKQISVATGALGYQFAKTIETISPLKPIEFLQRALETEDYLSERFKDKLTRIKEQTEGFDSLYFDFHAMVNDILQLDAKNVRLLFLIDDLDRCLPEKAVEMLESIKLFLELPGTAFVLAVDDEVVERGIMHRYRDYQFAESKADDKIKLSSPISGHEYLEKIITLPVRIDLAGQQRAKEFIAERCADLRKLLLEANQETLSAEARAQASRNNDALPSLSERSSDEQIAALKEASLNDELRDLLDVIPSAPRKLIRLSELFGLKRAVFEQDQQGLNSTQQLMLLRLVALQLFAPEVYRIAQRKAPNIFGKMHDIKTQQEHFIPQWQNYQYILDQLSEAPASDAQKDDGRAATADQQELHQTRITVLRALVNAQQHRNGFDPGAFLKNGWVPTSEGWPRFFGATVVETSVPSIQYANQDTRTLDLDELKILSTNSPSEWGKVTRKPDVNKLSEDSAQALLALIGGFSESASDERKRQWLQDNGVLLTADHFTHFVEQFELSNEINQADQQTIFDNMQGDVKKRLFAGDMLGFLDANQHMH